MAILIPTVALIVVVTFDKAPLTDFRLRYWDSRRMVNVRATTNDAGVARMAIAEPFDSFHLAPDCDPPARCDYVLEAIQVAGREVRVEAVHSQQWQTRRNPRVCDQLARVQDIVRGTLSK